MISQKKKKSPLSASLQTFYTKLPSLLRARGEYHSRQTTVPYESDKPGKFGIRFWMASDVDTKNTLKAVPYLGNEVNRPPG